MVDALKDKLNSYNPNVQFTVEMEDENTKSIDFLDLTIYNEGSNIKTKWYHKKIASNRILNFHSKHPKNMIMNVAKSLVKRVFTVSHRSFHQENLVKIKSILSKNSFPDSVIDKLIRQVQCSNTRQGTDTQASYPFLDTAVKDNQVRKGPMANSTMVHNNTIILDDTLEKTKVIYPQYALGFAGLTYIAGVTDVVKRQIQKHAPNLKVVCRPPSKVSQVF